jgi:DNA primase catalytic core
LIAAERVAEVRARHELVAFIESAGIKLQRKGRDLLGLCPFHNDREPSLSVSPAKQMWCCLGACSAGGKKTGGDVIEFARRLWRVSFRETLDRLGGNGASPPMTKRTPARAQTNAAKRSAPPVRSAPHDLLTQVALFYHQTLARSAAAKDYLASRGITSADVIAALPIGYADGSLLERAPEGSETHAALLALGVITPKGRELMDGCVVVPLRDLAGNVVGLYGRAVERDAHLYLPGPRRGLVNAQGTATASEIVITESVFDALSFIEAGVANVVPMYGTNGWTSDHDALLEQHRVHSVIVALDADDAGQRATEAIASKLRERGIDVHPIALPAKDANELLVRDGAEQFAATWKELTTSGETAAKEEAASSAPVAAAIDANDGGYVVTFGRRTWRVRGLSAFGVDRLRVNVRVDQDERFHVDTFDLYSARSRRHFLDEVATALMLSEGDARELQAEVARVIERLESERLSLRAKGKGETPQQQQQMSAAEREEAMELLRDPKLIDRIRADFAAAGCVGESDAMLVAYLAALSRKLDEPLAVLFCARSGAGKSNLQERVTDFVPPEDLVRYTRITGQALFYQDEDALKHKVLALDEEGGAADAIYSLRILQSSGTLSVSATRTDPQTGKHRAEHYEVHGPTSIFLTTAHPEALDYETRNRFVVLTADESAEQTRRILEQQRWSETLEGLVARKKREAVIRRHRNAQRLIQPLHVVNPHAPSLTFPSSRLILRREQKKYLALIRAIALLHQHQRRRKTIDVAGETLRYIEVTPSDIALAQQLAPMILRRDLDELAPPTRSLLTAIGELVAKKMDELKVPQQYAHLTRQEIQQATGLSYWHLRVYLGQLTECEYVAAVRGEQGKRYLYELLWDGVEDDPAAELAPQL